MNKKILVAVLVMLSFVGGSLLPRPNGLDQGQECKAETNKLKKGQAYKAGDYTIWYRSYRGKGATIEEKR